MSWLERRRPAKKFSGRDRRYLPQCLESVRRILERWERQTRDELRVARVMTIEPHPPTFFQFAPREEPK